MNQTFTDRRAILFFHSEKSTNFKIIPTKNARATDNKVRATFKFAGLLISLSVYLYCLSVGEFVSRWCFECMEGSWRWNSPF